VRGPDVSVGGQTQFCANAGEHGIKVVGDLGVGEARNADAQAFEDLRPPSIVVGEPFMLLAIEFMLLAIEFDDEL